MIPTNSIKIEWGLIMEFFKKEDVQALLDNLSCMGDIQEGYDGLKIYKAEYEAHMPIKIRDYGYNDGIHEYNCGSDPSHHWLRIDADGRLQFTNMQSGAATFDEESAKGMGECCFIPTYESPFLYGETDKYITPVQLLVIKEDEEEAQARLRQEADRLKSLLFDEEEGGNTV